MIVIQTRFLGDDVRMPLRAAHRDLLKTLEEEGILLLGGAFEDASGALLLFDAPRERVQAYLDSDPYMSCSDVEVTVKEWVPKFGAQRDQLVSDA